MAKGKNSKQQQQPQGDQQETTNNEKNSNEENQNTSQKGIVLRVFIHCEGCGNEVRRCLRGFEGVEGVEVDAQNHKVTVKGKNADPMKVSERIRKKCGKHVELISPQPKKQVKKEEKKPQTSPKVIEVVLKVYIHCEGCAKEVKHCIHKMEGVQTVDPEMGKNQVIVKGSMDPQKLVEFVNKRSGRHAEIVKQKNVGSSNNENQRENKEDNKKKNVYTYNNYTPEIEYTSLMFNDENPNSCSIM